MIKIGIIGPESTGKSTLAEKLAEIHHTIWIKEFAREYLENLKRPYVFEDLEKIAKKQFELINMNNLEFDSNHFCFIDTELIVMKVWSEFKYQKCSDFILKQIKQQQIDFYFLCFPDTPWEFDPLRENPNNRLELFEIYKNELQNYGFSFEVLSGSFENRLVKAEKVLNFLKK